MSVFSALDGCDYRRKQILIGFWLGVDFAGH